ncbi:MAG TPA: hypothetical protein VFZ53_11020, partial [Polyangiaceae bacterium]
MTAPDENAPRPAGSGVISTRLAAFLGWLGVLLGNAVAIAALPLGRSGLATRLVHLSFDAG